MITLHSFAKINLGLEITGKRDDGYHNLKTVFQAIDLHDTIEIKENSLGQIRLSGDEPTIEWDNRNTVRKAAESIYKNFNVSRGFDIFIKKKIPAGAGLGGGSSNAAVILMFLNRYYNLNIPLNQLIEIGAGIGADVPFFFLGGTVLAEGIGEKMTPLENLEKSMDKLSIAVVVPPVHVSTALIFSRLCLTSTPRNSKIDTFTSSRNYKPLENRLEHVTFQLFPEVGMVKTTMKKLSFDLVMMSGSGSAVFGISPEPGRNISTRKLQSCFPGSRVFETRAVNHVDYLTRTGASPSGKASVFGADILRFESLRPSSF